jgi:hypothetical protein
MGGDRRVDRILAQGETIRCYPTKVDHRHGAPFSTSGTMSHRTTTGRRGRREPAGTSARSNTAPGAALSPAMPAGARSPPPRRAKADAPAAPGLRAGRHATFGRPWRRPSRLRSGAGAADSGPDAGVAEPNHARRCAASNEGARETRGAGRVAVGPEAPEAGSRRNTKRALAAALRSAKARCGLRTSLL